MQLGVPLSKQVQYKSGFDRLDFSFAPLFGISLEKKNVRKNVRAINQKEFQAVKVVFKGWYDV